MINNNLAVQQLDEDTKELWSEQLQSALNKHIEVELSNFATYEELSNWFGNVKFGFHGMSRFLRKEADKELSHARKFMEYQNKRGGSVDKVLAVASDISILERSDNCILECYKIILDLEKSTYLSLLEIHDSAVQDPAFQNMIEECLKEQLDTQNKLNSTINILQFGGKVSCSIHEQTLQSI
jgi:ferritin